MELRALIPDYFISPGESLGFKTLYRELPLWLMNKVSCEKLHSFLGRGIIWEMKCDLVVHNLYVELPLICLKMPYCQVCLCVTVLGKLWAVALCGVQESDMLDWLDWQASSQDVEPWTCLEKYFQILLKIMWLWKVCGKVSICKLQFKSMLKNVGSLLLTHLFIPNKCMRVYLRNFHSCIL